MPPIEARETGLSSSNINGITNQLASHLSKHEQSPQNDNRATDQFAVNTETLFGKHAAKKEFFQNAKLQNGANIAMEKFYRECSKCGIIPMPLFAGIRDTGVLSMSSQYLSDGMANALGHLLADESMRATL